MISIYSSGADHRLVSSSVEELPALLARDGEEASTVWIDLNDPTTEEEDRILKEVFDFHPLSILDCRRDRLDPDRGDHLPKVEDFGHYLFAIINAIELRREEGGDPADQRISVETHQFNAYIGERFLVTHHYEPSKAAETTGLLCQKNSLLLERGPDYLYHLILDHIVDEYSPILDELDDRTDELEDEVFNRLDSRTLPKILDMKRQVFRLRRITTYQREMVYRLSRGEFPLVSDREIAYYRNVFDHLVRAAELAESYRDVLTGLLDAYLSMTSNRMNEVMKVLTIISTFFLPLTFIVGLYGMNFEFMPELHWRYGYPFVLGLMVLVSVGMFIFFRRKKWL
jgi:magnesium transporter